MRREGSPHRRLRARGVVWLALALLAFIIAPAASARWYQVEVVVFEHTGGIATGGEVWPELAEMPDFNQAMELLTDLPAMGDEPGAAAAAGDEPVAFVPLARAQMRLAGVEQRLRTSRDYHPLMAAGWRQPSFGVVNAKRVYLSDLGGNRAGRVDLTPDTAGILAPKVEGTVAIKVERLLHVAVDFLYYHDNVPVRMQETRNVKLREIHYFDHPLFGVIVQVSPFVLPEVPATAVVGPEEPVDEDQAAGAVPAQTPAPAKSP